MELLVVALFNGLSYGLLLFMLSAGLTLVLSLLGVLNFAHASFYMLGAYLGFSVAGSLGFGAALLVAPLVVGAMAALFERYVLRRVRPLGHVPELMVTFGLAYLVLEVVQLVWGRTPMEFHPPHWLQGPLFTLVSAPDGGLHGLWGAAPDVVCHASAAQPASRCTSFPATRGFIMLVALAMWLVLALGLRFTRVGLVIQASLTHPHIVQTLGHNVPRLFMQVFAAGAGLAALAGVVGGSTFVTEPGMAAALGPVIFVVVIVGGLGSLGGAMLAAMAIGLLQTFAVVWDQRLGPVSLAQVAPLLPYLLLVLTLALRPKGLLGRREG
jgi:branched-chain amino acid transport system permease protein